MNNMGELGKIISPSRAERKIRAIVERLKNGGYATGQFFSIGAIENRLLNDAKTRDIEVAKGHLYIDDKQVQHALRDAHIRDGVDVPIDDFVTFPDRLSIMELWYDTRKNNYVYLDRQNKCKYIVDTNRKIRINRRITKHAVVITAQRLHSVKLFGTDSTYEKING